MSYAIKARLTPRLGSIVWTDWPALFCVLAIPGIWLVGLLFPLLKRGASFGPFEIFAIAVPISVVAAGVLAWRILRIYWFFARGRPVTATITKLAIVRDRGRLEIEYEVEGRRHESWTPVHKNKRVMALEPGKPVAALVDPARPDRAIVRDLYV